MLRHLLVLLALFPLMADAADQKPLVINPTTGKQEQLQAGNFLTVPNSSGTLIRWVTGNGTPEGAVTAGVGSVYYRTDGGTGTTLYVKESGAGNTGWAPMGGSFINGTLTSGRVPFANGVSSLTDSAKMVFSDTTGFNVNMASSGANNLTLGSGAGDSLTSGARHVLIGPNAGTAITVDTDNTAVGYNALAAATGGGSTAVGSGAGALLTSGILNTYVGFGSGANMTTASNGTFVGYWAGERMTGQRNTGIGAATLRGSIVVGSNTGTNNTAVGASSLSTVSSGSNNTAVGDSSLAAVTTTSNSTAFGYSALAANTAAGNTAMGSGAADLVTSSARVTAMGFDALGAATTGGSDSSAFGYNALLLTTGAFNTAFGSTAMDANVSGSSNAAFGYNALGASTGSTNTAMGANAGLGITTGGENVVIGSSANTGGITTGSNNVIIGAQADVNTAKSDNVVIGWGANGGSGSNNIILGSGAQGAGISNGLIIGSDGKQVSSVWIGEGQTNASPVALTMGVTKCSTADTAGVNFTMLAGAGCGNGAGGSFIVQTSPAGTSGSSINGGVDALVITSTGRNTVGRNGATFNGNIIYGVGDATAAATRQVGEVLTGNLSTYTNMAATATYGQITTVSLTAGDWMIDGTFTLSTNSATLTANANTIATISTTTASATGTTEGLGDIVYISQTGVTGGANRQTVKLHKRINISSTTSYYLNAQATYTAGTPQAVGALVATRIR